MAHLRLTEAEVSTLYSAIQWFVMTLQNDDWIFVAEPGLLERAIDLDFKIIAALADFNTGHDAVPVKD